jgi:large-conductance mechanosensitive channel
MSTAGLLSTFFARLVDEVIQKLINPIIENPTRQLTMGKTKLHATMKYGDAGGLLTNSQPTRLGK